MDDWTSLCRPPLLGGRLQLLQSRLAMVLAGTFHRVFLDLELVEKLLHFGCGNSQRLGKLALHSKKSILDTYR